jgi:hypothetical protein
LRWPLERRDRCVERFLWDLLRQQLQGLDPDAPAFPAPPTDFARPLRLVVQAGDRP